MIHPLLYESEFSPKANIGSFPRLPYLVEPVYGGSNLDAYPDSWVDAFHCRDRKTYVHRMHVPGRSRLPVSLLRGYGAFLWGRYRCRGGLGDFFFFFFFFFLKGKTHVKSLRRYKDVGQRITLS